jgi:hypothetical protein
MEKENIKILSASRIKTLETCSWSYWASYHLKLPQKQNEGAARGSICHLVFELLLSKKHKSHYTTIMKRGCLTPAIKRLVVKHLNKQKINDESNYKLVEDMIWVGINADFYGKGGKLDKPEREFLLESESPKYKIKGFIDKSILYSKEDKIKIVDYKSSKGKFKDDDLTANVQAMTYTLASKKKLWPEVKDVLVEFVFLRFPKQPLQQVKIKDEELEGFEYYLEYMFNIINNFTEKSAASNFAADSDKNKWLCKAGATWKCPYYDAYDYYALVGKDGSILKTSFEEENLKTEDETQKIEKRRHEGCPAHKRSSKKQDDSFDF